MTPYRAKDLRASAILLSASLLVLAPAAARAQFASIAETGTRYAGNSTGTSGFSSDSGAANSTTLNAPSYAIFDAAGDLFLSDTLNNCVRKIDTSGNVTTVAGLRVNGGPDTCNASLNPTPSAAQGLYKPTGLAVDSAGTLYIADSLHHCVRTLASGAVDSFAANALNTAAGTCTATDTASVTPVPAGLAIDSGNNLYISLQDTTAALPVNQVVRHLSTDPATTVCYMAGQPSANVATKCSGVTNSVTLSSPSGLAFDRLGNLFVADSANNCVREIAGLTTIQTVVGQCGNPGSALQTPIGIAVSPTDALLISEAGLAQNNVVSFSGGSLTTLAGTGAPGPYSSTLDGQSALNTPLDAPLGLTTDTAGNIFLADSLNNVIRRFSTNQFFPATNVGSASAAQTINVSVSTAANLSTAVGTDYTITSNTCSGVVAPGASCQVALTFNPSRPGTRASAFTLTDSLSGKRVAYSLSGTGIGSLSLFTPGTVHSVASSLKIPVAVSINSNGDAYVLEQGNATTTADVVLYPAGGGARQVIVPQGSGINTATAMTVDPAGNVFIAEGISSSITRFGADGSVNTSYVTGLSSPVALAVDSFDNLYVAQAGSTHNVIEVYAAGGQRVIAGSGTTVGADNVPATSAQFVSPSGLAFSPTGSLAISDANGHRVYSVDPSGTIHLIAGNGTSISTNTNLASGTAMLYPIGLAYDAAGDLYVADEAADRVYEIYPVASAGTNISAPLGNGAAGYSGDGGPAPSATLNLPTSIGLDGSADLFVIDSANNALREVTYSPTRNIDFGDVIINTTSPATIETLANAGNIAESITTPIPITDPHFGDTGSGTTCTSSLAVGGVCNIAYTFSPTTLGPLTATSTITSNAYDSPQTVTLTAYGLYTQNLPYSLPPETEVYGYPFTETAIINLVYPDLVPTGSMTFTIAGETTCSTSGSFPGTVNCAAQESGIGVGTYTVNFAYTSGDVSYYSAAGTTTVTITPAPMTVTPTNQTKAYGAPIPALPGAISGVVNGDVFLLTDTTTATQNSPVGTYPITATLTPVGLAQLTNYNITYVIGTLTILPEPLTVTIGNVSRPYGGTNPTFTSTIVGGQNGDTFTVTYSTAATSTSPAGTYPITATVTGSNMSQYAVTVIPGTLTVTPIPLSVTVNNATKAYDTPNPGFSSTISGAINGDTFTQTFSTTATLTSPVGNYPITDALSGPAASNYTINVTPGTLTIGQASGVLTVTAANATRVYGAANPTFTSTVVGAVNGDTFTITYTTSATVNSPPGTYTITPVVSGPAAANYTVVPVSGTLTITPAPLTVTVNNATRAFGAANPVFTGAVAGLLNGDTVTVAYGTAATATSAPGTYPITASVSGGAAANYTVTVVPGVLTITAAATTTSIATSGTPAFYATPVTFTAVVSSTGGTPGGTVTFTNGSTTLGTATLDATGTATFTTSSLPPGSLTITASYGGASGFATSSASLTQVITAGTFTVTATPADQFVRGAGSSVYTVTVTGQQGFAGPVTLACSGLPSDASCTFATPTVTLTRNGTATTSMTVVNTAADAKLQAPELPRRNSSHFAPIAFAATFPFELTGLGVLFARLRRRKPAAHSAKVRIMLLLLCTAGLIGLSGCACFTSVYKNYTITVTGSTTVPSVAPSSATVLLSVGQQ